MTEPRDATEREFIEYRFSEVMKRLDRMEQTMNSFAFTKQSDFDAFAKEVRDGYVKKESIKWIQYIIGGIVVGVGVAIVLGVLKIVGDVL